MALRIYLNTSALNRPFDDLTSNRVRLEAEAVATLLTAIEQERVELVGSEYLDFEIDQDPDEERAQRVRSLLRNPRSTVKLSEELAARARELENHGLRGLDALHVASAEAGGADLLVTTDDRMLRRALRAGSRLRTKVLSPVEAVVLLEEAEHENGN